MQRKGVERLVDDCILASKTLHDTGTFETGQAILGEAAAALSALLAERDALQGQLNDLRNGWANSVKAHASLLAERDALRAAIFGGTDYATDLTNGNFVEMAQTTEAARLGALARAEKAEAERDAAFAAAPQPKVIGKLGWGSEMAAPQPSPVNREALGEWLDREFSAWSETSFDTPLTDYLADALLAKFNITEKTK